MNDPSTTDACDEDLLEDLEKEYVEMARNGNRDAILFAEDKSEMFCSTVRGLVRSILKCGSPGQGVLLLALDRVASTWAREELPKRIASMKAAHEDYQEDSQ